MRQRGAHSVEEKKEEFRGSQIDENGNGFPGKFERWPVLKRMGVGGG